MGIKGLSAYLKRHAAAAFMGCTPQDVINHVLAMRGKPGHASTTTSVSAPAVAVDIATLMYRIMYTCASAGEACAAFQALFQPLADAGIGLLFVFDGDEKANKAVEHARREERRVKEVQAVAALQEQLTLPDELEVADIGAWMLGIQDARLELSARTKRLDIVKPEDWRAVRKHLAGLGWRVIQARGEGEAACCWLAQQGHVGAVISDDFDTLACGAELFIRNFGSKSRECEAVRLSVVLSALGMSFPMFQQFCVLSGSDFTHHLPGMGPAKAAKVMRMHKTIGDYMESTEYKAQYGALTFRATEALAQFQQLQPPVGN